MIKKFLIALLIVAGVSITLTAKEIYARDASALPNAAQSILSNNFKSKVSVIKVEKKMGNISEFEVTLTDGSEIVFDRDGNWLDIEVGLNKSVPKGLIPAQIATFVKKEQPGQKIVGIERERKGYDVTLSNGVEMKFDRSGQFVKYER